MTFVEAVPKYIESRQTLFRVQANLIAYRDGKKERLDPSDLFYVEDHKADEIDPPKKVIEDYADRLKDGYVPTQEEVLAQKALCDWLEYERKRGV